MTVASLNVCDFPLLCFVAKTKTILLGTRYADAKYEVNGQLSVKH